MTCSARTGFWLKNLQAGFRLPRSRRLSGFAQSAEAAAFQTPRQIGDLVVYERRREPRGYLRLQTGAREIPRNAARRKRRDSRAARLSGAADEKSVQIQTIWAIRRVGLRAVPHIANIVDDLAFIHSCQGRSNDHVLAHYEWNTGSILMGFPSVGSWVTYGLGSENQNLPGFVVIYDARGGPFSGPANWSAGFLPAAYQGTVFRSAGDPILDLSPPSNYVTPEQERARLDQLNRMNQDHAEKHPGSTELAARIASYEMAYRMQMCAPEAVDISRESEETKRLYGLDHSVTAPFGKQCLLARRLVERGVRFIQLYSGSLLNQNVDTWDAHASIVDNHGLHAPEVDKPIAGLITDLKRRGLLDETLVMWHSEFGRMPISQRGLGRDHNPGAMTIFMAGAGIKGGQKIGVSDEVGYKAEEQIVPCHDLHATILHLLGLDHKRVTYFFNGRHMRLTDVHGELIQQIAGPTKSAV